MSSEWIVLGLAGFLAMMMLVRLMLRRQRQLQELLRAYSNSQLEWSRKKARAALIARRAAMQKADDSNIAALTNIPSTAEAQEV